MEPYNKLTNLDVNIQRYNEKLGYYSAFWAYSDP